MLIPSLREADRKISHRIGKGSIRQAAAAALLAVAAISFQPVEARAAATPPQTQASTQDKDVTPVWFGNGCFWVNLLTTEADALP